MFVCLFNRRTSPTKKAFSYDLFIQIRLLVLIIIWLVYICLKKKLWCHICEKMGIKVLLAYTTTMTYILRQKKCFQVLAALNLVKNWWNAEWKKRESKTTTTCIHNTTTQFYRWVYSLWILKSLEQCKRWWSNVRMKDEK